MKILVTGGGGYIGSSLILELSKSHEIISLDHGRHYSELSRLADSGVVLKKGDILDTRILDDCMKGADAVIHLAGGGGNEACITDPARSVQTNILGTSLLLRQAIKSSVDRFVFLSSYFAYSSHLERKSPLTEDMDLMPDDLYGSLKASAEQIIRDSPIDHVILRLSNVYGYGTGLAQEHGGVVNHFVRAGFERSENCIFGTGKQMIDAVHISDVCRAISMVIDKETLRDTCLNIGSGKGTAIEDIAKTNARLFKKLLDKDIRITRKPSPEGRVFPSRWLSISKIRKHAGWSPGVTLESGIEELIMKTKRGMHG